MNYLLENFGEVEFTRIETEAELNAALAEIQDYLELYANANKRQSPDYTAQRLNIATLLEQKRLSATIIKAEDWIISAYFGEIAASGELKMILHSGSPFYEIYRPHKLHSQILTEQGLTIDKARDPAVLTSSVGENAPNSKNQNTGFAFLNPAKLSLLLQKLRNYRLHEAQRKLKDMRRRLLGKKRQMNVYQLDFETYADYPMPAVPLIRCNSVGDLLKYQQTELWQPSVLEHRKIILERMQHGSICYTVADDDLLIYSLWLCADLKYSAKEIHRSFQLPENSICAFDAYMHPRGREKKLHQRATREATWDIYYRRKIRYGFTTILADNAVSIHVAEKIGYKYHSTIQF